MSDVWALALGIAVLAVWVGAMFYVDSLRRAYTLGRTDHIARKSKTPPAGYGWIACWSYRRGRRAQAMRHRIAVRDRSGKHYGNPVPR